MSVRFSSLACKIVGLMGNQESDLPEFGFLV